MDAATASQTADRRPAAPREGLAEHLFRDIGIAGVYARTGLYETIVERLGAFITREREPGTEVMRFPPVMGRAMLERSGYLRSFPNLLGCVCALHGSEAEIRSAADSHEAGGEWTGALAATDLVLTPAACYPVYPLAAARGALPSDGLRFDVACDCFRREPSTKLDRLQSFRMREYVRIGTAAQVTAFRDGWMKRGARLAAMLGLPCGLAPANDPFFGRAGLVKGISQRQQALKFELLVPLYGPDTPTACMSFNYHRDHFGLTWGLRDAAGETAHTGCAAFGVDRLAVALFWTHGPDPSGWPLATRRALRLADGRAEE